MRDYFIEEDFEDDDNGLDGCLGFTKYDNGKPDIAQVRPEFIEGIARALTYGAAKYSRGNWKKGNIASRYYSALQRHLCAFWKGNNTDNESGLHHLDHAGACLMMLRWLIDNRPETDNRKDS